MTGITLESVALTVIGHHALLDQHNYFLWMIGLVAVWALWRTRKPKKKKRPAP